MTRLVVDASCLGWPSSGTRRYLERVVENLARDDRFDILLVTNERMPVTSIPGTREVARRVKSGVVWRSTALVHEARRFRADVLWCPWPMLPVVKPCSTVVSVLDISPVLHVGTKPWLTSTAMAVAGRRAVRRADAVISISQTTADDVVRHWDVPPGRIDVVPLAVDGRFTPGDRDEAQKRVARRWGVSSRFLLAVGSIEPRKGYDLLPSLAGLVPETPVIVAGRPGPLSEAITSQLRRTCVLVGGVSEDELLDLYRAADVLLAPSLYEGFGLTPLEALACGTPAVVAEGSGAMEALLVGTMPVVPRTAEQWAAAVREVRTHRARWAAAGVAFAGRRSWADVAAETADVLLRAAVRR